MAIEQVAYIKQQTQAQKWAVKCNDLALKDGKMGNAKLMRAFNMFGGLTISIIEKDGAEIGKRFLFKDNSFADIYTGAENSGKMFFGRNNQLVKG